MAHSRRFGETSPLSVSNGTGTDGLTIDNNQIKDGINGIRFADYVQTGTAGNVGTVGITAIAAHATGRVGKVPMHAEGIRYLDGSTAPTYDWTTSSVR